MGLGERTRLGGLGLCFVDLGLVPGLHDRGLASKFRLFALRLLLGLGRGLVRLRLGNLSLLLDRGVVGRRHRLDVTERAVVDGLNLQGVDRKPDLGNFLL